MAVISTSINLSEFSSMSGKERRSRVNDLFQSAINPTSEQFKAWVQQVNDEIKEYESKYKMSSEEMLQSCKIGEASKFPDVCSWLMLVKTRGQIEKKYRCSRSK
jgi:hypothetical protein